MPLNARQVKRDIDNLVLFLLENSLAQSINSAIVREIRGLEIVTWADAPSSISEIYKQTFATLPEYYYFLSHGYFNILLFDGSIFQFGYVFDHNVIVRHRLLYYPCPLDLPPQELEEFKPEDDFLALIDLSLDEELGNLRTALLSSNLETASAKLTSKTPLRFDFGPVGKSTSRSHSRSHVHLNSADCRLAVHSPISIGHFVRFVFKNFYPTIWNAFERIQKWPLHNSERTISRIEMEDIFLERV